MIAELIRRYLASDFRVKEFKVLGFKGSENEQSLHLFEFTQFFFVVVVAFAVRNGEEE